MLQNMYGNEKFKKTAQPIGNQKKIDFNKFIESISKMKYSMKKKLCY